VITAEQELLSRCHPSCRTCTNECLLLQTLNVNGLALAGLKGASGEALIPFSCTACDLCAVICNRKLSPAELLREWRAEVAASAEGVPAGLAPCLTDHPNNLYTSYRRAYAGDTCFPEPVPAETVFFPGCAMGATTPNLALTVFDSLQKRYPGLGWLEGCCFDLLDKLGLDERYGWAQQSLAAQVTQAGARRIVTACPTCHYRLSRTFPELQIISIYQLLAGERRRVSGLPARIAVHDSCADRKHQDLGCAVRGLLPQTDELKHKGKRSLCCGAGGGVNFANPDLAAETARRRWAEVEASGAQLLVTYCTRCAVQLSGTTPGIPVAHILDLIFDLEQDYGQVAARMQSLLRPIDGPGREGAAAVRSTRKEGIAA
jgi:fumarate reductase (CoM/CoB) subunit B